MWVGVTPVPQASCVGRRVLSPCKRGKVPECGSGWSPTDLGGWQSGRSLSSVRRSNQVGSPMQTRHAFTITYDYLCPFARIANETVMEAIRDGADWEVAFRAFSLAQAHVEEGEPDVWERDAGAAGTRGVVALQWSLAVREHLPDRFLDFHMKLFEARHGAAANVDDEAVLRGVAVDSGIDADAVAEIVASGTSMKALAAEHDELADRWDVFGVPTFIKGDEAVFVRLMERHVVSDVDRVLNMLDWTRLNEFKRTRIPR